MPIVADGDVVSVECKKSDRADKGGKKFPAAQATDRRTAAAAAEGRTTGRPARPSGLRTPLAPSPSPRPSIPYREAAGRGQGEEEEGYFGPSSVAVSRHRG